MILKRSFMKGTREFCKNLLKVHTPKTLYEASAKKLQHTLEIFMEKSTKQALGENAQDNFQKKNTFRGIPENTFGEIPVEITGGA